MKIKCVQRAKFPIVGFVKDPAGVAALPLAKRERKDFVYVGKVGTGFNRKSSMEIRKKLDAIVSSKSRLVKAPAPQGRDLGRTEISGRCRIPRHHCGRLPPA